MNLNESDAHERWTSWLDEHGWRLLAHARQLHSQPSDAENLVQEVVLELWSRRSGDDPPDLPLFLRKLRHRAIDHGRSSVSRSRREQAWHEGLPTDELPRWISDHAFQTRVVQQALDQLDAPFREVISLKLWAELTFDQIATVLNIPRNTAASRYRLALCKLKPLLESILS